MSPKGFDFLLKDLMEWRPFYHMLQGVLVRGHMRFEEDTASAALMQIVENESIPRKNKTNEQLIKTVRKLARYANKNGTTLDALIKAAASSKI